MNLTSQQIDGASHIQRGTSHLINPLWKLPYRQAQRNVSMVLLSPYKLTIKIKPSEVENIPFSGSEGQPWGFCGRETLRAWGMGLDYGEGPWTLAGTGVAVILYRRKQRMCGSNSRDL